MRLLSFTTSSVKSVMLESIPEAVREISPPVQPIVEDILYNAVNTSITAHAQDAANVRRLVNDLALRVDNDISSVEVREIVKTKARLDRLSYVLEEQSITLGFPPRTRWRGKSDRIRSELANLRTSLGSLKASMDNTGAGWIRSMDDVGPWQ